MLVELPVFFSVVKSKILAAGRCDSEFFDRQGQKKVIASSSRC